MATTTLRSKAVVAAATLAAMGVGVGVAVGASPPDKSGGTAPVRLTLLNANDNLDGVPAVQRFVDRVHALSKGALTIDVRSTNDGHAGAEQRVVRDVAANRSQLAWVGTRVWDVLGVRTFRALHAPMLIDNYPLEAAVLRTELPARMLAGLDGHGVVGLALLADNLRYTAAKRPLRGPEDFHGLRIRNFPSATQAAAFRALGAHPSAQGWAEIPPAFRSGRLDALEVDLNTYQGNSYASLAPYVTVNLALWPRTTVLVANPSALGELSDQQRGWIQKAAADAARYSLTTLGEDRLILRYECQNGMKAVFATPAELALFRKAFAPVYASLRKDSATAAAIDRITALKRSVRARAVAVPARCLASTRRASGRGGSFPEGVFRQRRTSDDIRRAWPNVDPKSVRALAATVTVTFTGGRFDFVLSDGGVPGCRHGEGVYRATSRYVTVTFTDDHGCPITDVPSTPRRLRWSTDGRTLDLRIVRPAPPLDVVTWSSRPFVRIR
jgi:TRAP-type C4-dicarboxylate transport system substrate-binding protein